MEQKKKNNKKILIIILIIVIFIVCVGLIIYLNKESLNLVGNSNVNAPQLVEGMTPVKWNGNQWIETTTDDKEWYNYSNKKWANVKLADGSMFVWIPRSAYKITNGYHGEGLDYSRQSSLSDSTKQGGTIEIAFLNGISNVTFNNKTIDISNTNSQNDYVVHPAFKFGNEELQGIWVAKYEASRTDSTDTSVGNSKMLSFKDNSLSITDYDINNAMYYCRNMENQDIYGWTEQNGIIANTGDIIDDSNNFDTHLMKNVEWGAVCYLVESKYGINREITGNTSLISAKGGISSTTTGNETGIYDMAGQNAEFVSAYYNWGENNSSLNKYTNATKFNKKYVDVYNSYGTDNYGEAIYETSKDKIARRSWYEGQSDIEMSYPFFVRGKSSYSNSIYSYHTTSGDKSNDYSNYKIGFRATIVTSTDVLSDEENQIKKETIEKENIQNIKTSSLSNLIDSLSNTYAKGYMESMDKFTYTFDIDDVDFTEIRNYYTKFKTDYENFKTNISKYDDLQQEMKDIISATDEFLNEFDKATTQTNDVDTVLDYWESSTEKWQQSYRLVYKALFGKDID